MEGILNKFKDENDKNIIFFLKKLSKGNNIFNYKNMVMSSIEKNNKQIFGSIKNDKKAYLLMTRTYYINEFNKIERFINNEELSNRNYCLTKEKYFLLLSYLIALSQFEDLYINKNDLLRSLQIQIKIINIIKMNIINKNYEINKIK